MLPFELTKDTPYLALSGELWSVFYEYFYRNWSCYKGFLLYFFFIFSIDPVTLVYITSPIRWSVLFNMTTQIVSLTHWPLEEEPVVQSVIFKLISRTDILEHSLWNCPQVNVTIPHRSSVNIGSGYGLMPSGSKPLPESMLTKFYHMASLGHNQ